MIVEPSDLYNGIMIEKIVERCKLGFLPMDEYMEMALYDPVGGYYMKQDVKIGKKGDFFTSVSVSSVFGEVLADWIAAQGLPKKIVELGGGTGQLASVITQVLPNYEYIVVEASPYHQSLIRAACPGVQIVDSIKALSPFSGMVISNEFFDAIPVKQAIFQAGKWLEVGVTVAADDRLVETTRPAEKTILNFINQLVKQPTENQRVEVPLAMLTTYREICNKLEQGIVLTIDYGMLNHELRPSLRGFRQHQLVENILEHPGEVDITANVYFEELAKQADMETLFLKKQNQFLLDAGILEKLVEHQDPNPFSEASKRNRAIVQFILQGDISSYFYVLAQKKKLR